MLQPLIIIAIATYFIWKISSPFDAAASYLTRNLSEGIKGPTVNAIASSLPELLISFFFLFYIGDVQGFSAGFATIIGSSIFNIAMIPTICFLVIYYKHGVSIFPTDKKIILQDGIFLILTEIVLLTALFFGGISVTLALGLIGLYLVYIFLIIYLRSKNNDPKVEEETESSEVESSNNTLWGKILHLDIIALLFGKKPLTTFKAIIILLISVVIISISCKQLVNSSEHLSEVFNLNLFFVTFFIVAIASSVPDTILSVKDATNKKYKDAFSNAYASNIFDICIGIGLPVLLYLIINGINEISTDSSSVLNAIIVTSSVMLLLFTAVITLIYYIRDINLYRSILIISLYFIFLGTILYIVL